MRFIVKDFPYRDSDLHDMEKVQRLMDSIYANIPNGYKIDSIKHNPGEDKIFVTMKPDIVVVGKTVMKTAVE